MDATLVALMEELVASMEQRDAGDPDAPAWEAVVRIERLEHELASRLNALGVTDAAASVEDPVARLRAASERRPTAPVAAGS